MGGADNICSDKTGTLTKNDMDVVNMFIGGTDYDFAANPALFTPDSKTKFLDDFNDMLHAAICLNSTADYTEFVADEDNPEPSSKAITKDGQGYDPMVKGQDFSIFFEPRGTPTELALLKWLVKSGKTFEYWRNMRKTESQKPGYRVFDFSSLRKRSSVVISKDPKGNALGIHVKGGAE
jgi:magnesium-transporting ATPase (P-type)